MPKRVKNPSIPTEQELVIIIKILMGLSRMISGLSYKDAKKQAKVLARQHTSLLVGARLSWNMPQYLEDQEGFYPQTIISRLPDELKDIDPASLSRILKSLEQYGLVQHGRQPRTRGRPTGSSEHRGRDSYYTLTEYHNMMRDVLKKNQRWTIVGVFLTESGLLHKLLAYQTLVTFYIFRLNHFETCLKILKNFNSAYIDPTIPEVTDNEFWEYVNQLDPGKMIEVAEMLAYYRAASFVANEDEFIQLCIIGGLHYYH